MRTASCTSTTRQGRLAKAEQFRTAGEVVRDLADDFDDVADAYVTLCVHAGIAAADVICCARLGIHAQGQDHSEAVALLRTADAAARHLTTLLGMKTRAGYSALSASRQDVVRAERAAAALLEAARAASATVG